MKYSRKDKRTNKILFLIIIAIGAGLILLGIYKLHWAWNLIFFPLGIITMVSGYKNYKRTSFKIQEIEFKSDKTLITLLNGSKKEVKNMNLSYSLLVKNNFKPIRSIEIIGKKNWSSSWEEYRNN